MQDGPTISNLPQGHNLTTSTVIVNAPAPAVTAGSPLVKVLIKYPEDWKKDKFFKDGDVKEVSPETAETFVEIGIATMFDETKGNETQDVVSANAPVDGGTQGSGENNSPAATGESATEASVEEQPVETVEEQLATETKKSAKKPAGK